MRLTSLLLLALTLAQAKAALDKAMSSVNGKIAYENLLQVRIQRDRETHNAGGLATDTAKRKANRAELETAWKQWAVAYQNYEKAKGNGR